MPATDSAMMNDGSPVPLNLCEQIVGAKSKMAPNPYNLREAVSFTVLLCDDVKRFGKTRGELKEPDTRQQFVERAFCPHFIAPEESRVGSLRANKIIASVMCRSDNHVTGGESLKSPLQNRCWQVWTVAIEGNDVPLASRGEVTKNIGECCCQALTFLRNNLHPIAEQVHQFVLVRLRAHSRDLHVPQRHCKRYCVV